VAVNSKIWLSPPAAGYWILIGKCQITTLAPYAAEATGLWQCDLVIHRTQCCKSTWWTGDAFLLFSILSCDALQTAVILSYICLTICLWHWWTPDQVFLNFWKIITRKLAQGLRYWAAMKYWSDQRGPSQNSMWNRVGATNNWILVQMTQNWKQNVVELVRVQYTPLIFQIFSDHSISIWSKW